MQNWRDSLLNADASILDAMKLIEKSGLQIAVIVDNNEKLLGIVTDGDIRRGILKGTELNAPVETLMNPDPITVKRGTEEAEIKRLMTKHIVHQIPVVDNSRKIVDIVFFTDLLQKNRVDSPVVLMAGGLGTRLKSLTDHCPKPLLNVGSKPILHTIIESFSEQGFSDFYLSVNYRSEMIEEYFGNGERFGVSIKYLCEKEKLGTAGSLTLLPRDIKSPIIVMNGDVLTKLNYRNLLRYHMMRKAAATMAVREYVEQVPYGVIYANDQKDNEIYEIQEKPKKKYMVNAGIYVLERSIIDLIPVNSFYNMTQLFEKCISMTKKTVAYPINDYWIDIGRIEDFNKANVDFEQYFKEDQ